MLRPLPLSWTWMECKLGWLHLLSLFTKWNVRFLCSVVLVDRYLVGFLQILLFFLLGWFTVWDQNSCELNMLSNLFLHLEWPEDNLCIYNTCNWHFYMLLIWLVLFSVSHTVYWISIITIPATVIGWIRVFLEKWIVFAEMTVLLEMVTTRWKGCIYVVIFSDLTFSWMQVRCLSTYIILISCESALEYIVVCSSYCIEQIGPLVKYTENNSPSTWDQ